MSSTPNAMLIVSTCALSALFVGGSAQAYRGGVVEQGGTLRGSVKLSGRPSKPPRVVFPKALDKTDRSYCGSKRPLASDHYRVSASRGLSDVVVWLEGIQRGKPLAKKTRELRNTGCRFVPLVQTMQVGAKLIVINDDPIQHNTHPVYIKGHVTAFNIATPVRGQRVAKKIRRKGIMKVKCDAGHTWMRAWVHAFKHPYHTVTTSDGAFVLTDIPPGRYTLEAWHERSGTISRQVVVSPSGKLEVHLVFQAK